MMEIIFTLRTLFLAALIVSLMQIRVSGTTIESKAEQWLETSKVAHYIQETAAGGVIAVKDLYRSIVSSWNGSKAVQHYKAKK
jgi:hypothetical protein